MKSSLTRRSGRNSTLEKQRKSLRAVPPGGKVPKQKTRQRPIKKRQRAFEAMKDFCGIVSGPSNLSTNKEYLAGFGKSRRIRRHVS